MTSDFRERAAALLREATGTMSVTADVDAAVRSALSRLDKAPASRRSPTARQAAPASGAPPQPAPARRPARPLAPATVEPSAADEELTDGPRDDRPLFAVGVTTWNREAYIRRFIASFVATRSTRFRWLLVVADDGSTDGTLDYLRGLDVDDCQVVVVENKHATITGQTNAVFAVMRAMRFDFGMKCDDDIWFAEPGWDSLYYDAANTTGRDHLVYHNDAWKAPLHDHTDGLLHSSLPALDALGCLWTVTPRVLEQVGWFDEVNFAFRGHAHIDFTMRCCRAGLNDAERLWDAAGSQRFVAMWSRQAYVDTVDWKSADVKEILTAEERRRRMEVIADPSRVLVDADEAFLPLAPVTVRARPRADRVERRLQALPRFAVPSGPAAAFDAVFVLNLAGDPLKWATTAASLARHGVVCERFPAVNGNDEAVASAWRRYAEPGPVTPLEKQLNRRLIASPGAWGYLLTMQALLLEAKSRRLRRVLVFDDDVMLHERFGALLDEVWRDLPGDWKVLYLGCTQTDWSKAQDVAGLVYRPGTKVNGSFATALDASVFDHLLTAIDRFDWPYDSGPLSEVARAFPRQIYAVKPHLAIADVRTSDIRQERDMDRFAAEAHWDLSAYDATRPVRADPGRWGRELPEAGLVSVVMVVEDEAPFLGGALASLRAQTYGRFEVVVVDNASSDGSRDMLLDLATRDSRIRVHSMPTPADDATCLNAALRLTRGTMLTVHGARETSLRTRLESCVQHLDETGADAVTGLSLVVPGATAVGPADDDGLLNVAGRLPGGRRMTLLRSGLLRRSLVDECGDLVDGGEPGLRELVARASAGRRARGVQDVVVVPLDQLTAVADSPPEPGGDHGPRHDEVARGVRPAYLSGTLSGVAVVVHHDARRADRAVASARSHGAVASAPTRENA